MTYHQMLADVITCTFMEKAGKWQCKQTEPKALKVSFRTSINRDKEEGFRFIDLVLYADMNYVSVLIRNRWNVIALEDMEEQDDEMVPKRGKDYEKGSDAYDCICNHDSGWRAAVSDFLWQHRGDINGFDNLREFCTVVDPSVELGLKA